MLCFGVLLCAWTNVIWRLMEQTTTQSFLKRIHFFSTNMTHFYFFLRHFFSFWTHFSLFRNFFVYYRTHFSFHKIMDTLLFLFVFLLFALFEDWSNPERTGKDLFCQSIVSSFCFRCDKSLIFMLVMLLPSIHAYSFSNIYASTMHQIFKIFLMWIWFS